jgi:hypothetical protein
VKVSSVAVTLREGANEFVPYVILSLTDLGNILYRRYLYSGTVQVTSIKIGSVKAILSLWV